jgi:hypothetical protein
MHPSGDFSKKQIFWKNQVLAFQNSSLSKPEFCKQHGLHYSTFKNWFYRINTAAKSAAPLTETRDPKLFVEGRRSSLFQPVHVTCDKEADDHFDDSDSTSLRMSPSSNPKRVSPVIPDLCLEMREFRLAIPIGFDHDSLRSVLSILTSLCEGR